MNTVYKEYINAVMANVTPLLVSSRRRCLPSSPTARKTSQRWVSYALTKASR
jgi:hypothetical protein